MKSRSIILFLVCALSLAGLHTCRTPAMALEPPGEGSDTVSTASDARPKDAGEVHTVEGITISATKTERNVNEVPTNIAVVTQEDISKVQPTDVMDLLRQVPGLTLRSMGSYKASFYIGARGRQPNTRGMLLMMDGVEMNDPSNYLSVLNIPLNNIERIEVVKTPSSVLYGPPAVGGVIQIFTRQPTKPVEVGISGTYGSYTRLEPYFTAAGKLENGLTYGLNYWYLKTNGFRINSFTNQNVVTPRIGFTNDRIDFQLIANIRDANYGFPSGLPLTMYKANPTYSFQLHQQGDTLSVNSGAYLKVKVTDTGLLTVKSGFLSNNWRTEDFGLYFRGTQYWQYIAEGNYQQTVDIFGIQNIFLIGTQYRLLNNHICMYTDKWHGLFLLGKAEASETMLGFFLQDEIKLWEKFWLNVGVRYDYIWTDYKNVLNPLNFFNNSNNKWSPKIGFTYAFDPAFNIFGNYSEGIRTVFLAAAALSLTAQVGPEREQSFELGCRGRLFDRLDYNMALFLNNTKDKIVQVSRYVYSNAGRAQAYGLELGLNLALPYNFYAGFDYTYTNSYYLSFQNPAGIYDDKRVPLVPRNIFGATLGWRTDKYGSFNTAIQYAGRYFPDREYANINLIGDYLIVNMKYTYNLKNIWPQVKNLELSVAVNNLFDKVYAEYATTGGGTYVNNATVAYPADGRSVFASLAWRFH